MEILLLCGIYLVELACFWLGLRVLFEVRYKTKAVMIFGLVLPMIVELFLDKDAVEKIVWLSVLVIGVFFVSMEGRLVEKGVWLILVFLLMECLDGIFSNPCEQILAFICSNYTFYVKDLLVRSCTLVSIILLYWVSKKIDSKKTHINLVVYIIVGIIVALMIFCLAILNQVKDILSNNKYAVFCDILNIAVLMSVFLLLVFIVYIKNTHERMEQLLKTEQFLKESQVNYYKQILKKETDTRKYRHDMVNHLVYLQDILGKNRINDAQKYLEGIVGGFKRIQNTYYVIGNEMVETIMNYFLGMLPQNVEIQIKGRCPVDIDIEDTDVCTIFSNLFQNAVEEIIENNIDEAEIIVEILKGLQYVKYVIKNSIFIEIDEKCIDKNGLPISQKLDKHNHGIGMMNVKSAVERNHGKFEWYQEDGYFCVSIILPIK